MVMEGQYMVRGQRYSLSTTTQISNSFLQFFPLRRAYKGGVTLIWASVRLTGTRVASKCLLRSRIGLSVYIPWRLLDRIRAESSISMASVQM
jgi:hypothetical protein